MICFACRSPRRIRLVSMISSAADSRFMRAPLHLSCLSRAPIDWLGVGAVVSEARLRAVRDLSLLRRDELRRLDLARSRRSLPKLRRAAARPGRRDLAGAAWRYS